VAAPGAAKTGFLKGWEGATKGGMTGPAFSEEQANPQKKDTRQGPRRRGVPDGYRCVPAQGGPRTAEHPHAPAPARPHWPASSGLAADPPRKKRRALPRRTLWTTRPKTSHPSSRQAGRNRPPEQRLGRRIPEKLGGESESARSPGSKRQRPSNSLPGHHQGIFTPRHHPSNGARRGPALMPTPATRGDNAHLGAIEHGPVVIVETDNRGRPAGGQGPLRGSGPGRSGSIFSSQ